MVFTLSTLSHSGFHTYWRTTLFSVPCQPSRGQKHRKFCFTFACKGSSLTALNTVKKFEAIKEAKLQHEYRGCEWSLSMQMWVKSQETQSNGIIETCVPEWPRGAELPTCLVLLLFDYHMRRKKKSKFLWITVLLRSFVIAT